MPRTSFTNADLTYRRGESGFVEPQDEIREVPDPQAPKGAGRRAPVAQGPDIEAILADAKKALASFGSLEHGMDMEALGASGQRGTPDVNYGREFLNGAAPHLADGAMNLAMMAGGPVGTAAAGWQTLTSAKDMAQHPGVGNAVALALSALMTRSGLKGMGGKGITGLKGLFSKAAPAAAPAEQAFGRVIRPKGAYSSEPIPVKTGGPAEITRPRGPVEEPSMARHTDNVVEPSLSEMSAAAEAPPVQAAPAGGRVTDPNRMLPAFGETTETGYGQKANMRDTRSLMQLVQDLVASKAPNAKVTALKGQPMPPGDDPLAKKIRQRGHIHSKMNNPAPTADTGWVDRILNNF